MWHRKDFLGPWRGSLKTTTDQEKEVRKMNLAKRWDEFCREEDAMGVVEIILIIVVLISLVVIFKSQITTVVNNIMKSITKESKAVYGGK